MSQKVGHTGLAFARMWHHVDISKDKRTLGRVASQVALALMGKHKPVYHPSADCGDYVVVTNCQASFACDGEQDDPKDVLVAYF